MVDPHGDACPCAGCNPVAQVFDLAQERMRRDAPDPAFVNHDDYGRPMFAFLLTYRMAGAECSTTVWAYGMDDAETRVAAMRDSLALEGQIHGITDA